MSHFYGELWTNGRRVTKAGTVSSGLRADVRSWEVGVLLELQQDAKGFDSIRITLTGGSDRPHLTRELGTFKAEDVEPSDTSAWFRDIARRLGVYLRKA